MRYDAIIRTLDQAGNLLWSIDRLLFAAFLLSAMLTVWIAILMLLWRMVPRRREWKRRPGESEADHLSRLLEMARLK